MEISYQVCRIHKDPFKIERLTTVRSTSCQKAIEGYLNKKVERASAMEAEYIVHRFAPGVQPLNYNQMFKVVS